MDLRLPFFTEYLWLYELLALLAAVLIFHFSVRTILPLYEKRASIWKKAFIKAIIPPLTYFIWFFALVFSFMLIDDHFEEPFLENYNPVFAVGLIIAISWFAFRWKGILLDLLNEKSSAGETKMNMQQIDAMGKLATILIAFMTITALLEASGYGAATLLTIGGVGVAAIGFAAKEFIANFFGGFMIYLTKPFALGDLIEIPQRSIMGIVEEIGWYMTRIRDGEKQPIFIPNSTFSQVFIITPSRRSHRRIKEVIGVRYEDIESVPQIVKDIKDYIVEHPDLDHKLRQAVNFISYGDSSLNIEVFTYTKTADIDQFNNIKQEVLLKIAEIVKNRGADFPFNTYTLDIPKISVKTD